MLNNKVKYQLANAISLINLGLFIKLWMDKKYKIIVAALVLMLIIDVFKQTFRISTHQNTANCNIINSGDANSMPSSHVAVLICILTLMDQPLTTTVGGFAIMSWARVFKRCQSFNQSMAGGLIGLLFAKAVQKYNLI